MVIKTSGKLDAEYSTFLLYICSFSLLVGAVWKAEVIIQQEGIHEAHEAALHSAAKVIKFT